MDDIASSIITPIVQSLMVPVKKHLGFLVFSTKYVKDMDAKMQQLNDTKREVENTQKMAVVNTEVVPELVEPWLKDVKKLNGMAQSIQTSGTGCFNLSKRYKAGKRSSDILKEIEDLKTQKSEIKFTNKKISLARVPSTYTQPSTRALVPDGTQNSFVSRDLLFKDVLESLQSNDDSKKMIALCGMGGVGKTTMMEQLKKVAEDNKMFKWVVKVVLGENHDPIALQRAIAESVGQNLFETTKDARADRLRKMFEEMSEQGQKKILVIMDDVWKQVDLQDIGLTKPLPNGFKLLFTSRSESVCTQMGVKTDSIFRVRVLNEEEAKSLFFGIVGLRDDPELQKIGEDIVKKCGGLPIAIITIANVLSGNIKDAWKEALSNLQNHDLQDLDDIVDKVFEMSYNNLKKEDDKAVFLLSGLFPEDFDIPIEDLMMYGWGLKLFTKVHTLAEARTRANICVNNLIRANLLTESHRMQCVKMHDLVRAFVLSNFSKVKQASIVNHDNMSRKWLTKDACDSYERILLKCTGMSEFPVDFTNQDNLSLLVLMDGNKSLKFPKDLYKRMEKLEVVSFENMYIPLLPETFVHSTKLLTLCLRSCKVIIDDIYLIGSLSNLETLSFAYCGVTRLPSTIGKLNKLKLLDLTRCVNLCIEDGVFQNLESLEELYMRASPGHPIRFTDANCKELETVSPRLFALELEFFENKAQPKYVSFKKLKRFRISIGCELEDIEKYPFINTLHLVADYNELRECNNIRDLFEETEELLLQVNYMNHLEDVSMHHTFSQLRVLHVSECADLTYLFTFAVASGLMKLERLTVSECPVLRTLVGEKLGVIRFPMLNFMSLVDLPKMVSLCDDVIELPEMVKLRLDDLPNFTSIYSTMQSLLNKEVVIPKLEKLYIEEMENLKQIWPCVGEKNNVSMLKKIIIKKCDCLINLFPSNPLPFLNRLEKLEVTNCGSIEVLFNMEFESVCENSSRLRSIEVDNLGKLKELWRMKGVNKRDIHIKCFKGVENIEISKCSNFKDIFTPATANFDLGALTTYVTENTGEKIDGILKGEISEMDDSIPNVTYPSYLMYTTPHLQHLHLWKDKRVGEVVFDMDSPSSRGLATIQPSLPVLPYLQVLRLSHLKETSHLRDCDKIKYLFSPLMAKYLSNLKIVEIRRCKGIAEVISSRDDENEENTTATSSHQNITFFPHLDTLELENLSCLKRIDGGGDETQSGQVIGASWSFCQYPRKIDIYFCPALGSLIPWYAVGQMKRLQELVIRFCKTMMEIFESESSTNNVDEGSLPGTTLTTPTLKTIPTLVVPQLFNLKSVYISNCDLLTHVFTFSTLESLKQLEVLEVKNCKAIKVIVKEEEGMSSKVVVFPHLERLILEELPNLKGFFLGVNDFKWRSLDDVMISSCPQLMMFTSGQSKTPKPKYIRTSLGKHSLESCGLNRHGTINEYQTTFPTCSSSDPTISKGVLPWSFDNLIEINTESNYVIRTIIPSHALLQLQKLKKIHLRECIHVEEVFEVELEERNNKSGFNESQTTVVKIPNLTQVELEWVYNLKYLWKSTQWMVLEFPNLTTVSIKGCRELEHVFTCSMVGSLVQLQDLRISWCENIKVIVKEEEECCDGKVNEIIMLPRLKSLRLHDLSSLKGFCIGNEDFSLPALDTLEINKCPAITIFTKRCPTTPELKVIDTSFGKYDVKPDLNSFIKTKQEEGYRF